MALRFLSTVLSPLLRFWLELGLVVGSAVLVSVAGWLLTHRRP